MFGLTVKMQKVTEYQAQLYNSYNYVRLTHVQKMESCASIHRASVVRRTKVNSALAELEF